MFLTKENVHFKVRKRPGSWQWRKGQGRPQGSWTPQRGFSGMSKGPSLAGACLCAPGLRKIKWTNPCYFVTLSHSAYGILFWCQGGECALSKISQCRWEMRPGVEPVPSSWGGLDSASGWRRKRQSSIEICLVQNLFPKVKQKRWHESTGLSF